jgi:hypothetical protein
MGASWSSVQMEQPPQIVLVPPILDRDSKGRSKFAESAYDRYVLGRYMPFSWLQHLFM